MNNNNDIRMHPWLSVIIPIYNAERYLRDCINSVLMQTFKDFEVLLIDDGSTDLSFAICNEYLKKDRRVRYFKKENRGSFHTRIFGTEQARGEYILFCDADDRYANKNVFECLHKEVTSENCAVVQFSHWKRYNHIWRKIRTIRQKELIYLENFNKNEYPKLLCSFWEDAHLTTCVWDKLYHHSLLQNLPDSNGAERIFWGEDLVLNLFLLERCKSILFLSNAFYIYNETRGGTNKFSIHTMEDLDTIKKYQISFLNRWVGNEREKIENTMFAEIAAWFFIFIQQGIGILSDNELKLMIQKTLELPNFRLARKYFLEKNSEKWEAVDLLRMANADKYIEAAKKQISKISVKASISKCIKRIIRFI